MAKHGSIEGDLSIDILVKARSEEEIDAALHMWLDLGAHQEE